jgi:hypothetical protein
MLVAESVAAMGVSRFSFKVTGTILWVMPEVVAMRGASAFDDSSLATGTTCRSIEAKIMLSWTVPPYSDSWVVTAGVAVDTIPSFAF